MKSAGDKKGAATRRRRVMSSWNGANSEQQRAYNAVSAALNKPGDFVALPNTTVPSVVSLELPKRLQLSSGTSASATSTTTTTSITGNEQQQQDTTATSAGQLSLSLSLNTTTIVTPSRGHHELYRRLEELEGLEKEESSLLEVAELTHVLTSVVTGESYHGNSSVAISSLLKLGQAVPRRVCQHPFRKNDIVWVCRTCQADETCVLCHACFSHSNHEGHDVAFYHAQAGGCCDCGDPDAWDPRGFCPFHGPDANLQAAHAPRTTCTTTATTLSPALVDRVRGVVPACVDWMVQTVAAHALEAYQRAHPPSGQHQRGQEDEYNDEEEEDIMSDDEDDSDEDENDEQKKDKAEDEQMDNTTTNNQDPQQEAAVVMMMEDGSGGGGASAAAAAARVQLFSPRAASQGGSSSHHSSSTSSVLTATSMGASSAATATITNAAANNNNNAAASISNSPQQQQQQQQQANTNTNKNFSPASAAAAAAEALGRLGAKQQGLFIVLLADDVHSASQLLEALREFLGNSNFYTDTLLQKLLRALKQYGQLVLWGMEEMVAECGLTQVQLWKDGDAVACTRIGAVALERSSRLTKHGLFCSIATGDELRVEQRAVHVLQWMSTLARSCDPLCQTVAECILPHRHLVPLLRADFKMSARVTKAWYSLLLTLLAIPAFKSHLAAAYCDTYRNVTAKYARGLGVLERTGYTLSVQFLNRVTYVVDLVQGRDLLGKLGKAILETLLVASQPALAHPSSSLAQQHSLLLSTIIMARPPHAPTPLDAPSPHDATATTTANRRLNPSHPVLTHRRYSPCVSDLKCVLNVQNMPRVVACESATFLQDWISSLALSQWMDPQIWRHWTLGHVENESRGWVGAFNASISLGSLFERLLGWRDEDVSPISDPSSPYARNLMSCAEMTYRVLCQVGIWQQAEVAAHYGPTCHTAEPHRRSPCSLPMSTVAAKRGTALAMRQIGVTQTTPFSFHLPLHRFVSSCLRELCIRHDDAAAGIDALSRMLQERLSEKDLEDLFAGLLEFPTLILSRAAQVRSGLWRRNGPGLSDQVLNYSEPPFCRTMRDADLLMVQFAVLARSKCCTCRRSRKKDSNEKNDEDSDIADDIADDRNDDDSNIGMTFFVHLLIHRLGLFEFCGLAKAPNWNINLYLSETARGLYPRELPSPSTTTTVGTATAATESTNEAENAVLPWTYTPARESASCMVLLEEFLHLIIIFTSELPLPSPEDRISHTQQAQWKLYREVVHRLASGAKTHSELSEVQHVLSHWDNTLLSEEGKLINPDDATTASLGTCLKEIAVRKTSGRLEPDKWEMKRDAWDAYDPAFFHISLRSHQTAAENRPKPQERTADIFGWEPRPYAPNPRPAHCYFQRLRRDTTADATILAVAYRVLHIHCRQGEKNLTEVLGKSAYEEKSETALARGVHILTLGAYAWMDARKDDADWRKRGGGSLGSIFFDRMEAPTVRDWIHQALLAPPQTLLDCDWYVGEEPALLLLQRLAVSGGGAGGFVAQDCAVRSGAAWLCNFSVQNCPLAASVLDRDKIEASPTPGETELERRKREAKEKALARMQAQAAKFASTMDVELESEEEPESPAKVLASPHLPPVRADSLGSTHSSASSAVSSFSDVSIATGPMLPVEGLEAIPRRLLRVRPRCIICNYEESDDARQENDDGEGQRKRSRRKTDNALGFVGYSQPSTVLKGGGGPPSADDFSFRDHTGCFVQICSHAVHLSCCESYLATVSHREDRVGKRDEFRCPLCQRLSNCLVPFIDVGVDWIESPTKHDSMEMEGEAPPSFLLHDFLSRTPWWVTRHNEAVVWDGQSAFLDRSESNIEISEDLHPTRKPSRRRLKKKDLYAAWNAMMRTPRFVRRRLRPRGRDNSSTSSLVQDTSLSTEPEESTGETLVWRRFMDQISDISYRADSKRLGDDRLHDYFGEFRHYVIEKYAYNMANQFITGSPVDWPSCMFSYPLPDNNRQEMSREKLLSKLLLSIQCFTYSVSCEAFEARRNYRKAVPLSSEVAGLSDSSESVLSRFGISGVVCDGKLVVLPQPSPEEEDGTQPFDGRLGKLRYLALAVMAASGAVAADLVQLVLPFPSEKVDESEDEHPLRAPIAVPVLFGHVLTHVVAAMCAACGRGRARSDALDVFWPHSMSTRGSFVFTDEYLPEKSVDSVTDDCEGFIKLGLLARILQVLLAKLNVPSSGFVRPQTALSVYQSLCTELESQGNADSSWIRSCFKVIEAAFSNQMEVSDLDESSQYQFSNVFLFREACTTAAIAACDFLVDAGVVLQLLIPGVMSKYESSTTNLMSKSLSESPSPRSSFEQMRLHFKLETVDEMLKSSLVREVLVNWFDAACEHSKSYHGSPRDESPKIQTLRKRLYRTQGFRYLDWPSAGYTSDSNVDGKVSSIDKHEAAKEDGGESQPQDDVPLPMQIEHFRTTPNTPASTTTTEVLHAQATPALVTFSSKKTVPLLGGFVPDVSTANVNRFRPRVAVMPTSYTDLYAELGSLLPDCEQTAVCLICGEVLNAGGKGECTKHSYKCGAGAGMFFLLQECSGLIMHKSKAAYIHSPYVDSHGETPQFRGRPLNLDLVRYEHLREIWMGHAIRQTVVAERGSSRQVILPDFY